MTVNMSQDKARKLHNHSLSMLELVLVADGTIETLFILVLLHMRSELADMGNFVHMGSLV